MTQSEKTLPVYYLDAFTDKAFSGNPIAICPADKNLPDRVMQLIAMEINLSETAFIYPLDNNNFNESKKFSLRWFTPTSEVKLCGHGTLGTASLLFNHFANINDELFFETLSGIHSAKKSGDWIWLNFPRFEAKPFSPPEGMLQALGIEDYQAILFSEAAEKLLIEISPDQDIRKISPDFSKMLKLDTGKIGAVVVTQAGNGQYDFFSRYFTPWYGVNEDPVTGSAHSLLGPYWQSKLLKNEMIAFQASQRGGVVKIILDKNYPERVFLGGQAVEILKGEINIPGQG